MSPRNPDYEALRAQQARSQRDHVTPPQSCPTRLMSVRDELIELVFEHAAADRVRDGKYPRLVPIVRSKVESMVDAILAEYVVIPKALQDSINRVIERQNNLGEGA